MLVTSVLVTFAGTDDVGYVLAGAIVTAIVFALAHAWAHALARSEEERAPIDRRALLHSLRQEWTIVEAAFPATVVLALAALGLYSPATGLWIAVLLNVALMFVWGAGVRRLAGGSTFAGGCCRAGERVSRLGARRAQDHRALTLQAFTRRAVFG